MSLTAFKRKSVINYGSKRSGIAPGGVWLPQGPFGHATQALKEAIENYGAVGFSINGGRRNIGGVGRDMKMSKSGTPYRGTQPIGWGGTFGKYPSATLIGNVATGSTGAVRNAHSKQATVDPVLNSRVVDTLGTQYLYIKPSTLSTYGMLDKKYRWAWYGQYPNYWVQPNYTGNQTDSASQWLYIQNKAAANTCNLKHMKVILSRLVQHYVLQEDLQLNLHIMIWHEMLLIPRRFINQYLMLNTIYTLQEDVIILLVLKNHFLMLLVQVQVKRLQEQVLLLLLVVAIHQIFMLLHQHGI
jgi:hypothetical protein